MIQTILYHSMYVVKDLVKKTQKSMIFWSQFHVDFKLGLVYGA
jgi:hypothetical protein